eukprot:TRINITY_DN40856_c0_g1_i2.p3 TRINITY_DN40856_c0_g1~~TRINITY_DN40856_c0_g1_i2.p3  ORF type:complete len:119 (+),score=31.46 TRINITY_DN40856_c0_g1_i2:517-873(+)
MQMQVVELTFKNSWLCCPANSLMKMLTNKQEKCLIILTQVCNRALPCKVQQADFLNTTDKDGEISAEELKTTIFKITGQRMQDEEADEIVFECTKQLDADAKIQMDEFIEFMCTHQST